MITTVTTATTLALATAATSLSLIVVLTLLALLIQKELIGGFEAQQARRVSRALNVAIVPLLMIFIASATIQIVDILQL